MCRRRRVVPALFALALLAGGLPAPGTAQGGPATTRSHALPRADTVSAVEARLLARLDTLRSRIDSLAALRADLRSGDRAARPAPLDTLTVAGLRVIAPRDDTARARAWAVWAMERVTARTGPLADTPDPPTLRVDFRPWSQPFTTEFRWLRVGGNGPGTVGRVLISGVSRAVTARTPDPVRSWLGTQIGEPVSVYRELAVGTTPAVRGCFDGRVDLCIAALGLDGRESEGRLSPDARLSFLYHVLRSAPGGGLGRLMALPDGSATPVEMLEDVGGAPITGLVASWRQGLTAAGAPHPLPAATVATTALWILLFSGLATRSTRWRAG